MSRFVEMTWYPISEAIPKEDVFVLIRLKDDPGNIYRAKRVPFEAARYGFLFILINDYKLHTLPDDRVDETNAFCPASVFEWTYLTA